jgi:hypothetical protein
MHDEFRRGHRVRHLYGRGFLHFVKMQHRRRKSANFFKRNQHLSLAVNKRSGILYHRSTSVGTEIAGNSGSLTMRTIESR